MHRIDNPSAIAVLPALQPPGVPGFFSNGNPRANKLATLVDQDWLNTIQEEIAHVIEGAGLDLDKPSLDQLLLAIQLLVDRRLPPMPFLPLARRHDAGADLSAPRADAAGRVAQQIIC